MNLLKQLVLVCFILACFFSCKKVDDKAGVSIYDKFVSEMNNKGIATGNILVYKNGEIVHQSSNGLRSINPKDSLTLNSKFRLASVSKQFTAMAIMKLKEAGKLDYDQAVSEILPDFPYNNITVRHLLHHVSGLDDYVVLVEKNWRNVDSTMPRIIGNEKAMKLFHETNPNLRFQPGEKWEYSNTGYMYLASIVEKLSGQHFSEFLKVQVFDPLEMKNTSVYNYKISVDPNMPNRVFGYQIALNQVDLKPNDYNIYNGVRGDGGIYSTLGDLYKWNQALVNSTIIDKSYLEEAWTPAKLNNEEPTEYGFGWFIDSKDGEPKVVAHSGGWVGFITYLHNEVDVNSGFIILTNSSGDNYKEIYNGIKGIFENNTYDNPKRMLVKDIANKIMTENADKGIEVYHKFKNDTVNYSTSEGDINWLGYQLINENRLDDALRIFELNIEEYPNSANPHDSYADALLAKGDSLKALEHYKKCFVMDSTLKYANEKAMKLENVLKGE